MPKIEGSYKEYITNKIDDLKSGEYVILDDECTYKSKVYMRHTKCGHVFQPTIKNFTNKAKGSGKGTRCPRCNHQSYAYDKDYVKNYVDKVTLGEYTLLSEEYVNNKLKLKFKHNHFLCKNHEFEMAWNEFKNAEQRCPKCFSLLKSSKYHKYIRNFLIKYNIEFTEEQKFKSCKNKKHLPFDFYIPELRLLIEYDGRQHTRACHDDKEKLKLTQNNDDIKNKWVEDHKKYSLLRLSCSMEKLADIMHSLFIDRDSTTIQRYNLTFISSRVPTKLLSEGNLEQ